MSISKQLINGFIKSELDLFKKHFDEHPVPEIQDERSLAIAWLCYYFKESITNENSLAIIQFVDEVYSKDNYSTHSWHRISALQAAAFVLTSDIHYANNLFRSIDCGQLTSRIFIIRSTSIICPLISFNNEYLRKATEYNLKILHGFFEENVILYLTTMGNSMEKLDWLNAQISLDDKDYYKEFLTGLKSVGKLYRSGFFVRTFSRAKSYFIFKMLSEPEIVSYQAKLFDEANINFKELITLEKKHPLNDYYIDLSFLNATTSL